MSRELQKALTFFGAMAVVVIVGGVLSMRLLGRAAGPDAELLGQLKESEDDTLDLPLPGTDATLKVSRHYFQRVTVDADLEARTAVAVATLDLEGIVGAGPTKVSSVGLERVPFEYREGEWVPVKGLAPLLTGALAALEIRRRALNEGELAELARLGRTTPGALSEDPDLQQLLTLRGRKYQVEAWYLRPDHDKVEVREEYRLIGDTPDRPVDQKGARSLELKQDGGEFYFASGLM